MTLPADGSPGKRHHVRFWRCPQVGYCLAVIRLIGWQQGPTTKVCWIVIVYSASYS